MIPTTAASAHGWIALVVKSLYPIDRLGYRFASFREGGRMSAVPSALLFLAAVPGLLGSGAHAPARWKLFQGRSQHFSVRYPASRVGQTLAGGAYVAALFVVMYAPCRGSLWKSHESVVS